MIEDQLEVRMPLRDLADLGKEVRRHQGDRAGRHAPPPATASQWSRPSATCSAVGREREAAGRACPGVASTYTTRARLSGLSSGKLPRIANRRRSSLLRATTRSRRWLGTSAPGPRCRTRCTGGSGRWPGSWVGPDPAPDAAERVGASACVDGHAPIMPVVQTGGGPACRPTSTTTSATCCTWTSKKPRVRP